MPRWGVHLDVFGEYNITTTWCVPTHTMKTFPRALDAIVAAGHEIAAHGVYHEYIPSLELDEERRLLQLQVEQHERLVGARPRGYRSPALDVTDSTLLLLAEAGFEWDSSLMGCDFLPYRPRMVIDYNLEQGNTFGEPSAVLEFPSRGCWTTFPNSSPSREVHSCSPTRPSSHGGVKPSTTPGPGAPAG